MRGDLRYRVGTRLTDEERNKIISFAKAYDYRISDVIRILVQRATLEDILPIDITAEEEIYLDGTAHVHNK